MHGEKKIVHGKENDRVRRKRFTVRHPTLLAPCPLLFLNLDCSGEISASVLQWDDYDDP